MTNTCLRKLAHRSKHGVLLVRRPGARGGRDRREADDGRAAAGGGPGAGIGRAALEEGGVELAQLDGLGDGCLDVLARGRGTGRGRGRRRGVEALGTRGGHGHGGGGGSKAAPLAPRLPLLLEGREPLGFWSSGDVVEARSRLGTGNGRITEQ